MQWSTFWTAFGALATLAAVGGILLAGRQLRFDAWIRVQEIFVERKFVKARGRVFRHLRPESSRWDSEDQKAGLEVCRKMDDVCRLALYFSLIPFRGKRVFLEVFGDPLGKSWALLEPLVMVERRFVDWQSKWNAFQQLGRAALNRLPQEKRHELKKIATRLDSEITGFLNEQGQSTLQSGPPNKIAGSERR